MAEGGDLSDGIGGNHTFRRSGRGCVGRAHQNSNQRITSGAFLRTISLHSYYRI